MSKPDVPDPNCLHCKLSLVILDHFRAQQSLAPEQYPQLGSPEVRSILTNIAQVAVDVFMPCEHGEEQLHRRVAVFAGLITKFGLADLRRDTPSRPEGVPLQ